LIAPTLVVVIGEVEDDVDEVANVLNAGFVVVQIDEAAASCRNMAW
jgi:hypothetical protein